MASVSLAAELREGHSPSGETPEGPVDDRDGSFSDPAKSSTFGIHHESSGKKMAGKKIFRLFIFLPPNLLTSSPTPPNFATPPSNGSLVAFASTSREEARTRRIAGTKVSARHIPDLRHTHPHVLGRVPAEACCESLVLQSIDPQIPGFLRPASTDTFHSDHRTFDTKEVAGDPEVGAAAGGAK